MKLQKKRNEGHLCSLLFKYHHNYIRKSNALIIYIKGGIKIHKITGTTNEKFI